VIAQDPRSCASCGDAPAGPGQILCGGCADRISARDVDDWYAGVRDLPGVQAPEPEEARQ
jgi:hypothetical protein